MVKIEVLANASIDTIDLWGYHRFRNGECGYTVYMIAQKITVNDGQHYIISIAFNVMLGIYSMIMGAFAYLNNHQFERDTKGMEMLDSCCAMTQPVCTPVESQLVALGHDRI